MASFYKAVVLLSLLHGSETWAITKRMYQIIDSFHQTASSRRIAKLPIKYDRKKGGMDIPNNRKIISKGQNATTIRVSSHTKTKKSYRMQKHNQHTKIGKQITQKNCGRMIQNWRK